MPKPLANNLADLGASSAEIREIRLPANSAQRLKSMGIFEGQHVTVAKTGCPMIVMAAGGRVAIAREIAEQIVVEAAEEAA